MQQRQLQYSLGDIMHLPDDYALLEFDSIDSTNLEAWSIVEDGRVSSSVTVIIAKSQTKGAGKAGRVWVSESGNLFCSLLISKNWLRENMDSGKDESGELNLTSLPFISALAVGYTIKELTGIVPEYKWPNDILVGAKKVSGILIEVEGDFVVIGIGVNIANYPKKGVNFPAISLNEYGGNDIATRIFLESLLLNFDKNIRLNKDKVIENWLSQAFNINKNIVVDRGKQKISGVFKGVNSNGELILETNEGRREFLFFGDVM